MTGFSCFYLSFERGIAPGRLFNVAQHPQAQHNKEYLILACTYTYTFQANDYEADGGTTPFIMDVGIHAHPSSQPYRPARITLKPISQGPDNRIKELMPCNGITIY